jgi:hypothetical protein
MTNKLKGFLVGFVVFFIAFLIINSTRTLHWSELDLIEKLSFPFFLGLLGGVIGFLIGSGIKEKTS